MNVNQNLLYWDKASRGTRATYFDELRGPIILAWIVRLTAFLNLVAAMFYHEPKFLYWLSSWMPFEISEGRRITMMLTCGLLLFLASGLERGKRTAWWLTVGALLLIPWFHYGREVIWTQFIFNYCCIWSLIAFRKDFVAKSDQSSIRTAFVVCPALIGSVILFGMIRLHALDLHTSGDRSWLGCAQTASELVLTQNTCTQTALTDRSANLFSALPQSGLSILALGLILVLRPVLLRHRPTAVEIQKVQEIIANHSSDSFDSYALLSDKSYFFAADNQVVVAYVLTGNRAVALANPIGPLELRNLAILEFGRFCRLQDWQPIFYQLPGVSLPDYTRTGFSVFKIAEEATLQADQFSLSGGLLQNVRTSCNRAKKAGMTFLWYDESCPRIPKLEQSCALISNRWLKAKGATEMSFDMGSFSIEEMRNGGMGVVLNSDGDPIAFSSWRSFAQGRGVTLDLMRYSPDYSSVMDYVLVESIAHFKGQGIQEISLAGAPLANTEAIVKGTEEKILQFFFHNLNSIYGYRKLYEYKRKFRPIWRNRYIAYKGSFAILGLALVRVHAREGIWKLLIG